MIIGTFLAHAGAGATNDFTFIRMRSVNSPWRLTVNPNGSGLLGYGSAGSHSGNFSNYTFDVESLADELKAGSTTNQPESESFNILLTRANGTIITSFWTTNISLVIKLLYLAHENLANNPINANIKTIWDQAKPSQMDDLPNHTSEGIRRPADGSPKPSR